MRRVPAAPKLCLSCRIIERFGLEGTFKGRLVQPPCHEQGHLPLDQVAQSPVQPALECCQGWGIYNVSGQLDPADGHNASSAQPNQTPKDKYPIQGSI